MRIGLFGGSFDPVHVGHLVLAEACREQGKLDRVFFVPAARPPHKLDHVLTPIDRRLDMLQLAVAGYPPFQVSDIEKDRPGPSFTIDTLRQLREQHVGDDFFLLLGSDSLAELPTWKEASQIAELATLLVVGRPASGPSVPLSGAFQAQFVRAPLLEISSRDIRRRVTDGRSIRYLVPRAVECYVETHHLYMMRQAAEPTGFSQVSSSP